MRSTVEADKSTNLQTIYLTPSMNLCFKNCTQFDVNITGSVTI